MLRWCCAGAALVLVAARQGLLEGRRRESADGASSGHTASRPEGVDGNIHRHQLACLRGSAGIFTPTGFNMTFFPNPRMQARARTLGPRRAREIAP